MASAAYLSASLLGDLSDVPHMLDAPTPAAGAPLAAAVAASYHLLSATGSIDTAHKFLRTALEMTPGEFSPADDTLLEAFYTWVRVCYFGNRASLWHDFDRLLARMPNPPAALQLQAMLLRDPARTGAAATGALDEAIAGLAFGFRPAPRHPRRRGQELHRRGRIAEARAELLAARQTFSDLDASPWFARAGDELRSTGLRELGRPSGTTADLLTPQQARIASLAARGLTNKEIGRELHLSPRTVSTHLYQIFPKLNVTSRAGLRDALSAAARARGNDSR